METRAYFAIVLLGTSVSFGACRSADGALSGPPARSDTRPVTARQTAPAVHVDDAARLGRQASTLDAAPKAKSPAASKLPRRSAGCAEHATRSRVPVRTIETEEGPRQIRVAYPPRSDVRPAPIVVLIHPYGSTAKKFLDATKMAEVATKRGAIVIAPDGINRSFNGGDCCGTAARRKMHDVDFVLSAVDTIAGDSCVDLHRVYATGFSNGGFLSLRLACERSDRIAAVVSVGAVVGVRDCNMKRPVPTWIINGIGDKVIPPDGGGPFNTEKRGATIETLRSKMRCGAPDAPDNVEGTVCVKHACGGGAELKACTVPYAHVWMTRRRPPSDDTTRMRTSQDILEFLERFEIE